MPVICNCALLKSKRAHLNVTQKSRESDCTTRRCQEWKGSKGHDSHQRVPSKLSFFFPPNALMSTSKLAAKLEKFTATANKEINKAKDVIFFPDSLVSPCTEFFSFTGTARKKIRRLCKRGSKAPSGIPQHHLQGANTLWFDLLPCVHTSNPSKGIE